MELTLHAPALLFPTVSLLLLAYTNRFLALATLIRNLHAQYKTAPSPHILAQIHNLRRRVKLIRDMQVLGVFSLFLSALCMFLIFRENMLLAKYAFSASLLVLMLMASLGLSIAELYISIKALNIQLGDMEEDPALQQLNKP
jgi:hypothetical protein